MIGNVAVGGGETIKIQSMSTFKISDVDRAVSQCALLKEAGLDIMRFSVLDEVDARSFSIVKSKINIPLVADIHFDYKTSSPTNTKQETQKRCINSNPKQ